MQVPQPPGDRQQTPSAAETSQAPHTLRDTAGAAPALPCCGRAAILDGMLPKPVATRSSALNPAQQAALAEALSASAAAPMSWHPSNVPAVVPHGQESASRLAATQTGSQPTSAQVEGAARGRDGPLPAPQPNSVSLILAAMLGLPSPAAPSGTPLPLSWQPQQTGAASLGQGPALHAAASQETKITGVTRAVDSEPVTQSTVQPRSDRQEAHPSFGSLALHNGQASAAPRQQHQQQQPSMRAGVQGPQAATALPQPDWQVLRPPAAGICRTFSVTTLHVYDQRNRRLNRATCLREMGACFVSCEPTRALLAVWILADLA